MASFKQRAESTKGRKALKVGLDHALSTSSIVPVIWAYIEGGFLPEDAKKIDETIKHMMAAAIFKQTGVNQPVVSISGAPRVSEAAGMLKCGEWDCAKQLFATLGDIGVSLAMLVKVTTWFRKRSGIAKKGGTAPTRETLLAEIKKAQPKRNASKPKTPVQVLKANPLAFIDDMIASAKVVTQVYGKRLARSDAATLTAMLRNLTSIKQAVAVTVLEDKKA